MGRDMHPEGFPRLLTPAEVGKLLRVSSQTVTRWAKAGKLASLRTSSNGPRRYYEDEVQALLRDGSQ